MDRRKFIKWLGLAPVAAVIAPSVARAVAATEMPMPAAGVLDRMAAIKLRAAELMANPPLLVTCFDGQEFRVVGPVYASLKSTAAVFGR